MNRTPVKSSQIHAIGYDGTNIMEVEFASFNPSKPRSVYRYRNVTPEDHAAFISAPSIGKHFKDHIKCQPVKYPYEKLP